MPDRSCCLRAGGLPPQHVALAAAVGLTELKVFRRVRVAVFSTGDEIVEPGTSRPAPALFDANRYLLAGLIEGLGAASTDLGILPDDPERLARAIANAARTHDLVVTSGGVSTGEADHVRHAVETVGRLVFWRVGDQARPAGGDGSDPGIKSGRECGFRRPARQPGRGLRHLRARGAAAAAAAWPEPKPCRCCRCRYAPAFGYRKKAGRREYVRVKLVRGADGAVEAVKHAQEGAGIITSLTETDGLVELSEDHDDGRAGLDRRVSLLCRVVCVGSDPHGRRRERHIDRLLEAIENNDGADRDHDRRDASDDEGAHG